MKMAKKVLSVFLAIVMALSCFAVASSAVNGNASSEYQSKWVLKGAVGSISWTSNTSFTQNKPTTAPKAGTVEANPGETVWVYLYVTTNYFVSSIQTNFMYSAGLLDPQEAMRAALNSTKTLSAANFKKFPEWNKNHPFVAIDGENNAGTANATQNCWSQFDDANKNGAAKNWPTVASSDTTVKEKFSDGRGNPDLSKWHFSRCTNLLSEESLEGVIWDDTMPYLFAFPLTVPSTAAAGTEYEVVIDEGLIKSRDKLTGILQLTEMGFAEGCDEIDGTIDADSVSVFNMVYDNENEYFDLTDAVLKIKVPGGTTELDFDALQEKYDAVKNTDVTNATAETKGAFQTALNDAANMLANQSSVNSQDDIDAQLTALTNAYNALAYYADYTALDEAINAVPKHEQSYYTTASWTNYQNALTAAQAVSRTLLASQQGVVDTAKNNLVNAFAALTAKTGANYEVLNDAIAAAENKIANESTWYTSETWSAMMTAYNAAKAVPTDLSSEDQATITNAATALANAIGALVEADADYTALASAITAANALNQADYTAASWSTFASKLAAAEAVPAGLKAKDQSTIDNAKTALTNAQAALVPLSGADYTALDQALLDCVAPYQQSWYTTATWSAYNTAKTAAQNIDRTYKTTEQYLVDNAKNALVDAFGALELVGADYTVVENAKVLDLTDVAALSVYTSESLQAYVDAVNAVVAGKKINEQEAVNAMAAAITAAYNNLQYVAANTKPLDDAILAAANYSAANYTAESYAALTNAVAAGQAILDRDVLDVRDNADIQDAADAITTAINNLVPNGADYRALNQAIADFEAIKDHPEYYTTATFAAAQSAYEAAKAVPATLDFEGQSQIDNAAAALANAIGALVEADANYKVVNDALATVPADSNAWRYTEETWQALQNAKNAVVTGLKAKDQATVNGFADAINAAVANLAYSPFDFSEFNTLVEQWNALDEDDYTPASWANVAAKYALVNTALTNKPSEYGQAMLQVNNFKTAYNALVPADEADYSAVEDAIAEADALNENDYTAESWAALQNAIDAVDYDLNENHQGEVDEMADAIFAAIDELVKLADYTALNAALAAAAELNAADWTAESWAVLEAAVAAGNAVEAGLTEADQPIIDNAAKTINDAIDALVPYVAPENDADYTALDAALAAAAQLNAADWSDTSWAVLEAAVAAGNAVDRDLKESDQAIIDKAAQDINNAISALVPPPVVKGTVVDVAYTPSTTYRNTFDIKVEGRANFVQFIEPDGGTRSFDRYDFEKGLISITSYDKDGNQINPLDIRNLAYEVWEVNCNLIGPDVLVRAKYNTGWEATDLAYSFVYELAPAKTAVYSATLAAESGKTGPVVATVVTGADVEMVQFKMDNNTTVTIKAEKAVDNGDGTLTFSGYAWMNHSGENVIAVRTYGQNKWTDATTMTYNAE